MGVLRKGLVQGAIENDDGNYQFFGVQDARIEIVRSSGIQGCCCSKRSTASGVWLR